MDQPDEYGVALLAGRLAVALGLAGRALSRATEVLLGAGADAESGIKAAEQALHELQEEIDEDAPNGAVFSASGALDVRVTVAVVHFAGDLERLADLTQQITEIAWSRRSRPRLPGPLGTVTRQMGESVLSVVAGAGEAMEMPPPLAAEKAARLETTLGRITEQQRRLDQLLISGEPPVGAADAVDVALLGRCYEGCARHAVSAAHHVAELVT